MQAKWFYLNHCIFFITIVYLIIIGVYILIFFYFILMFWKSFALFNSSTQLHKITILLNLHWYMYNTFSSAKHFFPFQIFLFKIWHFFPGYKKISGTLGKLGKVYHRIIWPFLIRINKSFCTYKSDFCLTGKHSCHYLICTQARNQGQIQPFILKVSLFNINVLRGKIENEK